MANVSVYHIRDHVALIQTGGSKSYGTRRCALILRCGPAMTHACGCRCDYSRAYSSFVRCVVWLCSQRTRYCAGTIVGLSNYVPARHVNTLCGAARGDVRRLTQLFDYDETKRVGATAGNQCVEFVTMPVTMMGVWRQRACRGRASMVLQSPHTCVVPSTSPIVLQRLPRR